MGASVRDREDRRFRAQSICSRAWLEASPGLMDDLALCIALSAISLCATSHNFAGTDG